MSAVPNGARAIALTHRTSDTVSLPLLGNRELSATLFRSEDGIPLDVVLNVGFSEGAGWRGHGSSLAIPADVLPQLIEALDALKALAFPLRF